MTEIGKDINEFEKEYQVSNLGRVRSINRKSFDDSKYASFKGKILKMRKNRNGYLYVLLSRNGNKYHRYIHRLVANAFLANPYNKKEVDHINSDKENNEIINLRWVTHKENMNNHITKTRLTEANKKKQRHNRKYIPIVKFTIDMKSSIKYNCISDACDNNNYDYSTIKKCCDGHRRTAYGFIWKYI